MLQVIFLTYIFLLERNMMHQLDLKQTASIQIRSFFGSKAHFTEELRL